MSGTQTQTGNGAGTAAQQQRARPGRKPSKMRASGTKRVRRTQAQIAAAAAGGQPAAVASIEPMPIVRAAKSGGLSLQATVESGLNALTAGEKLRSARWIQDFCAEIVAKAA